MKSFKEFLKEDKQDIPLPPGSTPIPKDHVRLYHQTVGDAALDSIKKDGIKLKNAKGYEGPKGIYSDPKGFYGSPEDRHTVEFSVHKDEYEKNKKHLFNPTFQRDIKPSEIIALHRPWHKTVRYIRDNPNLHKAVLRGDHDSLLNEPEYGEAIKHIKNYDK